MKKQFIKIFPLVLLYLCFILLFLSNSNYESIITLTASIPLASYIFTKNLKAKLILKYVLYTFAIALIIYVINLLISDYHWFQSSQRIFYSENIWDIVKWNQFFIYDLKYLIYLGIIFLSINNNHKS